MLPIFSFFVAFCFSLLVLGPPIRQWLSFYSTPLYQGGRKELTGTFLSPLTLSVAGAPCCQAPGRRPPVSEQTPTCCISVVWNRGRHGESPGHLLSCHRKQSTVCLASVLDGHPKLSPSKPCVSACLHPGCSMKPGPASCLKKLVRIPRVQMSSSCPLCHVGRIDCRSHWWVAR